MRQIFKILLNIALIGLPEIYKWLQRKSAQEIKGNVNEVKDRYEARVMAEAKVDPKADTEIIKK